MQSKKSSNYAYGPRMLLLIPVNNALNYLNENLNTNQIKEFIKPYNENEMKAHTVLRFQRKEFAEYINSPKVQEFHNYPELAA